MKTLIAFRTLTGLLAATVALPPIGGNEALASSLTIIDADVAVADRAIEQLMSTIRSTRTPLPVWAIDMAMRAYKTYKTYKNGEKVEEVRQAVLSILKEVANIKTEVENGRQLSDREYRLAREALDMHSRRLEEHGARIAEVERVAKSTAAEVKAWRRRAEDLERRVRRKGCGVGHAWRNGRCVDVAANPR